MNLLLLARGFRQHGGPFFNSFGQCAPAMPLANRVFQPPDELRTPLIQKSLTKGDVGKTIALLLQVTYGRQGVQQTF